MTDPVDEGNALRGMAFRVAITPRVDYLSPGVVVTSQGVSYLLAEENTLIETKRYKAIPINAELAWRRRGTVVNPATLLEEEGVPTTVDPALKVHVEFKEPFEDQGFEHTRWSIYTGADVRVGDTIGDYQVKRVVLQQGVRILEGV